MIFWGESLGLLEFPVLTAGCLSGFLLIKRVVEAVASRRGENLSVSQRKRVRLFMYLIAFLGGFGLLIQIILKVLALHADGQ